jgi:nucleoside-diphosphate-sugar epimerase
VGDGLNRWAGVHRLDAAHLYRLALEKASAGARYHGIADEGVAFRDIAGVIGRRLNVPVVRFLGLFAGLDVAASSQRTRELLGWQPTQPGLIADLDQPHYFKAYWPMSSSSPAIRSQPRCWRVL